MTDVVDKANADYERWLQGQIGKSQQALSKPINGRDECIDCGGPIGAKRKQALPHAVRCIECQRALESKK